MSINELAKAIYKNNSLGDIKKELAQYGNFENTELSKKCLAVMLAEYTMRRG